MVATDDTSWLPSLLLLVPVVLAARRRPRSGGKKQPRPRRQERLSWFELLVVVLSVGTIVGTLGFRLVQYYASRPSQGAEAGQSLLPSALKDVLSDQMRAEVTRNCPRLAALTWGDGGRPRQLVVSLVSVECMSLRCEQPGGSDAGGSTRGQPHPLCQTAFSGLKDQMMAVTNDYRLVCPEVAVPWAERTWSPSTELGFYAALRTCMERICERLGVGAGIPASYCETAADIAEGLGDERAAARLRERAQAGQALNEVKWQGLSPEQREKAEIDQNMKLLARRWGEVCGQGMAKYCEFLAEYCRVEGYPPEVCPGGAEAAGAQDAGAPSPPRN